jgi:hypothetical protein
MGFADAAMRNLQPIHVAAPLARQTRSPYLLAVETEGASMPKNEPTKAKPSVKKPAAQPKAAVASP